MEIKNDTIYQIETKVFLYKNEKYYPIFRNIFINDTLNFLLKKRHDIIHKSPIREGSKQNQENLSLWNIVTNNLKKKKEIIDYDLNNYIRNQNHENEDDYFFQYLKNQTKVIEINNLVYLYLRRISKIKLHRLISISNRDKIPLINLMKIYLGLCSQNFASLNKKIITIKEGRNLKKHLPQKTTKKSKTNEKTISASVDSKMKRIPILKIKVRRKMEEINKKNISKNQSEIEEEKQNQMGNSNSAYDEMINEQIQRSLSKLKKKSKKTNNKILYSSSLARLFIGETDKESIREKYLSNFEIKKEKKLEKNKNKNLSSIFLKVFLSRLEQNKENKLSLIEKGIENTLVTFKKNQEIIDKFRRLKYKNINKIFFNDPIARFNRTANKFEKINYKINNVNISKMNKLIELNRNKNKHDIKLPHKLTKTILPNNKHLGNNFIKINDGSKTHKYSNFSYNKILYKEREKQKQKENIKFIYDYNYNSNLKKYLEMNKIESIKIEKEEKIKLKSNMKKNLFKRKKDNDVIILNGNLTTRVKKDISDSFWKYNLFKQKSELRNNNIINYITKNDMFFESL